MPAELPARSGLDLGGVTNLVQLFLGKNSSQTTQNSGGINTTGTRTTTDSVPQAAIDATVKSILEGSQGLAAVSSGQNRAGLYNSTSQQMLVNDLIARSAAEGAKLNKSTTTTVNESQADNRTVNTSNKTAPQIKAGKAVTALGGLTALSKFGDTSMGKKFGSALGFGKKVGTASDPNAGPTEDDVKEAMNREGIQNSAATNLDITPLLSGADIRGGTDISSITGFPGDISISSDLSTDITGANNPFEGNFFGDTAGADFGNFIGGGDFNDAGVIENLGGGTLGDVGDTNFFDFAEGGHVTPHGNANKLSKGMRPGYASGGMVDLTNTGLRVKPEIPIQGTQTSSSGGAQSASSLRKPATSQSSQSPKSGANKSGDAETDTGMSSVDAGTTNGQVGTPSQNQAAVTGFALGIASAVTGVPVAALSVATQMLGIQVDTLNPLAHIAQTVNNIATLGTTTVGNAVDGLADSAMATLGLANPNDNQNIASIADQDNAFDSISLDGNSSDAGGGDAAGEGGGVGGSGASAGDGGSGDGGGGSSSDGSGSDGGSASAATGKYIQGAGTETSDSIDAKLSDGEFVLNAEAVKAVGLDTLNWVNDTFKPSPAKLAQGRKIRVAQRGE